MFYVKNASDHRRVDFFYSQSASGDGTIETFCRIYLVRPTGKVVESLDLIAHGKADCHPKDQFCKNTGRKLALARALKMLTSDRKLRRIYWEKYFETRHGER